MTDRKGAERTSKILRWKVDYLWKGVSCYTKVGPVLKYISCCVTSRCCVTVLSVVELGLCRWQILTVIVSFFNLLCKCFAGCVNMIRLVQKFSLFYKCVSCCVKCFLFFCEDVFYGKAMGGNFKAAAFETNFQFQTYLGRKDHFCFCFLSMFRCIKSMNLNFTNCSGGIYSASPKISAGLWITNPMT